MALYGAPIRVAELLAECRIGFGGVANNRSRLIPGRPV
jgi:hypothetical protein